jgi:hypothetical protein
MRFVTQLLSLLLASPLAARVVSVFGPGRDSKLVLDDLSLRDPRNFGFDNLGSHAAYMTTFFFEKMAASHAGKLSLSHYFPGIVITPAYKSDGVPSWFKGVYAVTSPIFRLATVDSKECGVESEWSSTPHPDFRRGHQAMRLKRQPKLMLHHLQTESMGVAPIEQTGMGRWFP